MSCWTPERRKRQSELAHLSKPWERSTGPATAAGKAKSREMLTAAACGRYSASWHESCGCSNANYCGFSLFAHGRGHLGGVIVCKRG
jgi:hypothetical protein